MAGFLRKFATNRKNADVEHPAPSKPVVLDVPPSLPPLFARFATTTLAEPESSLLESYIMPVAKVQQVEDEWDPWKALIEDVPPPPPPAPEPSPETPRETTRESRVQPLPLTRRKYTGPGLPPQVKVAGPDAPPPHPIRAVSTRQDPNNQHSTPISHHPSPITPPSLSQDNQARSYPPQASQTQNPVKQKPGSSSSSSSNHTDATRFGSSSSAFTSTSSIAPAIKHIDVTRVAQGQSSSSAQPKKLGLGLAASPTINSVSTSGPSGSSVKSGNVISQPLTVTARTQTRPLSVVPAHAPALGPSLVPTSGRSPAPTPALGEQALQRNLMSTTTTLMTTRSPSSTAPHRTASTTRSTAVSSNTAPARSPSTTRPPTAPSSSTRSPLVPSSTRSPRSTAVPSNTRPSTTTHAIPSRQNTQPLNLRSPIELSAAPIRKGPLIFAAMAIGQGQVAAVGQVQIQQNGSALVGYQQNSPSVGYQQGSASVGYQQNSSVGQQQNSASVGLHRNQNPPASTNQRTSIIQQAPRPISQLDNSVNATSASISAPSAPSTLKRVADHEALGHHETLGRNHGHETLGHNHGHHETLGYPSPPAEYMSLDRGVNVPLTLGSTGVPSSRVGSVPSSVSTSVPFSLGLQRGGSERVPVSLTSAAAAAAASAQGQGQGRTIGEAGAGAGRASVSYEAQAGRTGLSEVIGRSFEAGRSSEVGRSSDAGPARIRVSSDASSRMPPPSTMPLRKLSRATSKESLKPRVLTKSRPPTPSGSSSTPPSSSAPKLLLNKLSTETLHLQKLAMETLFSEDTLFLDEDPFKKVEGVRVVKMLEEVPVVTTRPVSPPRPKSPLMRPKSPLARPKSPVARPQSPPRPKSPLTRPKSPLTPDSPEDYKSARTQRRGQWLEKTRPPLVSDVIAQQEVMSKEAELLQEEEDVRLRREEAKRVKEELQRLKEEEDRRLHEEEAERLKAEADEKLRLEEELANKPPSFYPIAVHLADASLLPHLLAYLTFADWCSLYAANKEVRVLFESRVLREYVLEHFLRTVGYARWRFEWAEPLALSLKDLNDYMRGVSMPTHQYAQLADAYLQPRIPNPGPGDQHPKVKIPDILALAMTTRAYTRVVMRLRSQAESEARAFARSHVSPVPSRPATRDGHASRDGQVVRSSSSRTPSPTSLYSHSKSSISASTRGAFRSPLVKLHRAPLLRVFVPSPEGEWLSDSSVVECEAELKRAGVLKLLRVGDVVWDVAVGDEGNLGRMVWDGSYLVDLDHKYSRMGELSPYFHSLAFSPSYFHRVIRTGVNAVLNPAGNPIVYLDVSHWGQELAANLQLLQDRATTATPHGTLHSVVHWLHRSSFTIRPPVSPHHPHAYSHSQNLRLPIPNVAGFFIDPGWYGTVIVEAEGTNEGLADFQARCGPGAFPPRADNVTSKMRSEKEKGSRRVYRVLREKSRPGEIWIRAVREKERVM